MRTLFDSSLSGAVGETFARAKSTLLCDRPATVPALYHQDIESLLPQRDTLLLLDSVSHADLAHGRLCARYDLDRARDLLRGHFPDDPIYPGVLQVEAIGQAGALLHALSGVDGTPASEKALLVHILGARFRRQVEGSGILDISVEVFEDGLLFTTVGQTIQHGHVCTAAAVSSIVANP